ncbi:hypothetical protein AAMO2058_000752900 [Amorphochlora amoebiformis]
MIDFADSLLVHGEEGKDLEDEVKKMVAKGLPKGPTLKMTRVQYGDTCHFDLIKLSLRLTISEDGDGKGGGDKARWTLAWM